MDKDDALRQKIARLLEEGRAQQALSEVKSLQKSASLDAHLKLMEGAALQAIGELQKARDALKCCLDLAPEATTAMALLAVVLRKLGLYDEALAVYERLLKLESDNSDIFINLAYCLNEAGQHERAYAISQYRLQKDLHNDGLWINCGNAHRALGNRNEARMAYEMAVKLAGKNQAGALTNLAAMLADEKNYPNAISMAQQALSLNPGEGIAAQLIAVSCQLLGDYESAVSWGEKAIALTPADIKHWQSLAHALRKTGRYERAEEVVTQLEQRFREAPALPAIVLDHAMVVCDFARRKEYEPLLQQLIESGQLKAAGENVFYNLARFMDERINHLVARHAATEKFKQFEALPKKSHRQQNKKIRLGYVSADFHNHATMHLLRRWFELHDRNSFELFFYSYGPDEKSWWRQEAIRLADSFVDVRSLTDRQAAEKIWQDEIDIAIDLKGFTEFERLGILAYRPAPIQITWLGFPGTSGCDFFDYVIADAVVVPEASEPFYSEKVLRLPVCYQPTDITQPVSNTPTTRSDWELPEKAIVFASFNQSYKIDPMMFDVWMQLLKRLPQAVLWLLNPGPAAAENLRKEVKRQGIEPSRLIFAPGVAKEAHLERLRHADMALDTRIYTGHTTTTDMILAGVPVVTCKGTHFASRVAASILQAAGLPMLVTTSLEEYAQRVVRYFSDEIFRTEVQQALTQVKAAPLFDAPARVKELEAIYLKLAGERK